MYFDAGLKVENNIYLIEGISRSLVSIHLPSGKTRIEASLPWKYTKAKIGMLAWKQNIFIYAHKEDHFLVYDRIEQKINKIELQGNEADEVGYYQSNVLMEKDEFIILPFKGKSIKRYTLDGKLKTQDDKWYSIIHEVCGCSKNLSGNIRVDSACVVGGQLFFSLFYGNTNYLCKYELDKDDHKFSIAYYSEDVVIRGVYAYPGMVLFRRIFPNKTEIVLIDLNSDEQRIISIADSTAFEEDIYGDVHCLKISLKDKILQLGENALSKHKNIYNFRDSDVYISNGILVNAEKNEVKIVNGNQIKSYSIEKIIKEITCSESYREEFRILFCERCIMEGEYNLQDLKRYIMDQFFMEDKKKGFIKSIGECIWNNLDK